MFVFGGRGAKGVCYKDVYFLDLLEWVWVPVSTISSGPRARFYHASEVVGRKVVLHSGWDGEEVFNDLWIFNSDSFTWMQPRTAGFGPTPRYGHSITLSPDGRLFIFGGASPDKETLVPKYNDDIRVLDTDTMIWTRPRMNGATPTGRYGHSATLMDDGKIIIFGGWGRGGCQTKESINDPNAYSLHVLDTKSMHWYAPRKLGKKPIKHVHNHGACRAGNSSSVLLYAGCDGRQAISDFAVINLELEEGTA